MEVLQKVWVQLQARGKQKSLHHESTQNQLVILKQFTGAWCIGVAALVVP